MHIKRLSNNHNHIIIIKRFIIQGARITIVIDRTIIDPFFGLMSIIHVYTTKTTIIFESQLNVFQNDPTQKQQ